MQTTTSATVPVDRKSFCKEFFSLMNQLVALRFRVEFIDASDICWDARSPRVA